MFMKRKFFTNGKIRDMILVSKENVSHIIPKA